LNGLDMPIHRHSSYMKTTIRVVHIGETNRVNWSEPI
jgi:hypothetical protein